LRPYICSSMSLSIASLNSGSNGNCYYVGNDIEAVLVDAGISCRETEKRMLRLGLSMSLVKAVFISHEHSDHIRGLATLAKKYHLPVYITPQTLLHSRLNLNADLVKTFCIHEAIDIGSLRIKAFDKLHDASDPHSFMISCGDINIGVFTDIGDVCEKLIYHFKQCHAAFLEANYDELMLEQSSYPYYLKRRIMGGKGHLSNAKALQLFTSRRPAHMSHLLLSHLSKNNNCPELVHTLFSKHAKGVEIIIAGRYQETAVYKVSNQLHTLPAEVRIRPIGVQAVLF
jgi:phosphoribosyl 1,2-cyclic phosphodiesterase